eukprot:gnl/TRDRNA2_/TRDRNA2_94504_c0_seq1.p1 gnl/TRDRNA2_/TRDRNA2_94504_c0~~gnl/TRDRNA2_/TRDRNA2_94504_c0_seq1.p1  ORF type:complete len:119 (-),score=4.47 gnl/TRDRNA2_/TRDRNA2_94504_c0_seq1:302-658(-)
MQAKTANTQPGASSKQALANGLVLANRRSQPARTCRTAISTISKHWLARPTATEVLPIDAGTSLGKLLCKQHCSYHGASFYYDPSPKKLSAQGWAFVIGTDLKTDSPSCVGESVSDHQ